MTKISGSIHFELPIEKLDQIIDQLERLEVAVLNLRVRKRELPQTVQQKMAMAILCVCFPTFKKYLSEFNVRSIRRGGRLFYNSADIERMVSGKDINFAS